MIHWKPIYEFTFRRKSYNDLWYMRAIYPLCIYLNVMVKDIIKHKNKFVSEIIIFSSLDFKWLWNIYSFILWRIDVPFFCLSTYIIKNHAIRFWYRTDFQLITKTKLSEFWKIKDSFIKQFLQMKVITKMKNNGTY